MKFKRLNLLCRQVVDFFTYLRGTNYFHLPEREGKYFHDGTCYYVQMRGKFFWKGRVDSENEVPVLYFPQLDKVYVFPSMVLQWGLGAIEVHMEEPTEQTRDVIIKCFNWLERTIDSEGLLDNHFMEIDPEGGFISNYSDMTQGLAISFLHRCGLLKDLQFVENTRKSIMRNLVSTFINRDHDETISNNVLYEYFCKNEYVVLNGWIFAVFGLYDYAREFKDPAIENICNRNVKEILKKLDTFIVPSGWSKYDNNGRLCSPIYHDLHIHQLNALSLLSGEENLKSKVNLLIKANTKFNRNKYTVIKIIEKLWDKYPYSTEK